MKGKSAPAPVKQSSPKAEVVIRCLPGDVQGLMEQRGKKISLAKAAELLMSIERDLQDRSIERGWEVMGMLL